MEKVTRGHSELISHKLDGQLRGLQREANTSAFEKTSLPDCGKGSDQAPPGRQPAQGQNRLADASIRQHGATTQKKPSGGMRCTSEASVSRLPSSRIARGL